MDDLIIWSAPCGSWGACKRSELLTVPAGSIDAGTQADIEDAQAFGDDPRPIIEGLLRNLEESASGEDAR